MTKFNFSGVHFLFYWNFFSKLLHNEAFILLSQTMNKKKLTFKYILFRIVGNKSDVVNASSKAIYLQYREIGWCKITKKLPKLAPEW